MLLSTKKQKPFTLFYISALQRKFLPSVQHWVYAGNLPKDDDQIYNRNDWKQTEKAVGTWSEPWIKKRPNTFMKGTIVVKT